MFGQELTDELKASLILRQFSFGVLLDLHDFLMRAPDHENIRRVSVLRTFMVVFEDEWLLLPCVSTCRGQQNLERSEFVLGFGVA